MLEPLEHFFRRVGCLILLDRAADPAANGHVQRNGTHIKVYSGGAARSLSDVHAQLHAIAHQPGGGDALAVDAAAATGSLRTLGTTSLKAAAGDHIHASGADISARVFHSLVQSIPNSTWTALAFNSERWDTNTIHDNATNNGRLTATTAGKYTISAHITFAANVTGIRRMSVRLNGLTDIAQDQRDATASAAGEDSHLSVTTQYNLAANDYVDLIVHQNSGVALDVKSTSNFTPEFMMMKVLG